MLEDRELRKFKKNGEVCTYYSEKGLINLLHEDVTHFTWIGIGKRGLKGVACMREERAARVSSRD